eukprot:gene3859-7702_t
MDEHDYLTPVKNSNGYGFPYNAESTEEQLGNALNEIILESEENGSCKITDRDLESLSSDEVFVLMHSFNNFPTSYLDLFNKNGIDGKTLAHLEASSDFSNIGLIFSREWELKLFAEIQNLKANGIPEYKLEYCLSITNSVQGTIQDIIIAIRMAISNINDLNLSEKAFDLIAISIDNNKINQQLLGSVYHIELNIIQIATHHIKSPTISEKACQAINQLCIDNDINTIKMVTESVALAIKSLSYNNTSNTKKFNIGNVCEKLIKILSNSKEQSSTSTSTSISDVTVIAIFYAVRNLSFDEEIRNRLSEGPYCTILINTLNILNSNAIAVEVGCLAVFNLSFNELNRIQMIQANVCECISTSLHNHILIADNAGACCRAICKLSYKDHGTSVKLGQLGVCHAIVSTLIAHTDMPNVVEWALKAIYNLSIDNIENKEKFFIVGVFDAIVSAIKTHPSLCTVLTPGLRALYTLVASSSSSSNKVDKEYIDKLRKLDVHVVILDLLVEHSNVVDSHTVSLLGDYDGCETVVLALWMYLTKHPEIVLVGTLAVGILSETSILNAIKLSAAGGCDVILCILRVHTSLEVSSTSTETSTKIEIIKSTTVTPSSTSTLATELVNSTILRNACRALISMFGEVGLCEALVLTLQSMRLEPLYIETCCQAIFNLCFNDRNKSKFGTAGLCEILPQILHINTTSTSTESSTSSTNANVVCAICKVISILAIKNSTNAEKLGKHGVCSTIIAVITSITTTTTTMQTNNNDNDNNNATVIIDNNDNNNTNTTNNNIITTTNTATTNTSSLSSSSTTTTPTHLIEWSFRAISSLTTDCVLNSANICTTAACTTIIRTIRSYLSSTTSSSSSSSSLSVIEWGSRVISILAENVSNNREELSKCGACELTTDILRRHMAIGPIAGWCLKTICSLCIENESNITRFRSLQSYDLCVQTFNTHIRMPAIVEWSCKTLLLFISHLPGNGLLSHDTMENIVLAIKIHMVSPKCLLIISALAIVDANKTKLGVIGACEAVTAALRQHTMHVDIIIASCKAITALCANSKENKDRISWADTKKLLAAIANSSCLPLTVRVEAKGVLRYL